MDVKSETWNIRSLYRLGSMEAVSRELAKYKFDLVGVQEVRWEKDSTELADDYTFFYGNDNRHLWIGLFIHQGIISAVKRVQSVSDRISYIILQGGWCDIIVLNMHAPAKVK